MPVLNQNVGRQTPMGATIVTGGTTFRTWAPTAQDVYVVTDPSATSSWSQWKPDPADRMTPLDDDTWAGFVPGIGDGDPYLFWIRGPVGGTAGFKRDPYARELAVQPPFPNCPCLVRPAHSFPWHDAGWLPPAFHDVIIYQLHVGVFWGISLSPLRYGTFLDVVGRIPYLRDLGVTAIQLLPIQEYDGDFGLGYAGLDYFSPEMAYQIEDSSVLGQRLATVNTLLAQQGQPPVTYADLVSGPNQLRCLIDLCHLNGLAVIFDLVFNHAGGGFDDRSLWFYDRQPYGDDRRSLYFSGAEWAGGKVFDYSSPAVRQFLIDNSHFWINEYHVDGIRYDEVTVIHEKGGDGFCRDLTGTIRYVNGRALQIAEYWGWDRAFPVTSTPGGLGFDAALADGVRIALRTVLAEASAGADAHVSLNRLRDALYKPVAFPAAWCAVQHIENHDVVRWDYDKMRAREPRVPALADPSNPRSWYARSRARVVSTLLLTAPGIPMLFMGQEILEDKPWHDDIRYWSQFLIWWDGLTLDQSMKDFSRFMQDLIHLRRQYPALRGEGIRIPQVHEDDRIIVMHRWVEGEGKDIVIVASFAETTRDSYPVQMPFAGKWREIFNSDFYDHFPNPWVAGNAGSIHADGPPGDIYPYTASFRVPANGAVIMARLT